MLLDMPRGLVARSNLGRSQPKLREVGPGKNICMHLFDFAPEGRSMAKRAEKLRVAPQGRHRVDAKDYRSFFLDPQTRPAQAPATAIASGSVSDSNAAPRGEGNAG